MTLLAALSRLRTKILKGLNATLTHYAVPEPNLSDLIHLQIHRVFAMCSAKQCRQPRLVWIGQDRDRLVSIHIRAVIDLRLHEILRGTPFSCVDSTVANISLSAHVLF